MKKYLLSLCRRQMRKEMIEFLVSADMCLYGVVHYASPIKLPRQNFPFVPGTQTMSMRCFPFPSFGLRRQPSTSQKEPNMTLLITAAPTQNTGQLSPLIEKKLTIKVAVKNTTPCCRKSMLSLFSLFISQRRPKCSF